MFSGCSLPALLVVYAMLATSAVIPVCRMQDFEIVSPFRKGAQSTTTLVQEKQSGLQFIQKNFNRANDFRRERHVLQQLRPHQHMIGVKCVWNQSIVFEKGEANLLEMRWPRNDLMNIISQLFHAISALHSMSIIHGDVKPNNAVLSANGLVKLIDFGFSGGMGEMRCGFGTAGFMAPELRIPQCDARKLGPGIDWWAAGVSAYILLVRDIIDQPANPTDLLPFDNDNRMRDIPEDAPPWIQQMIRACLDPNIGSRMGRVGRLIQLAQD